MSTLMLMKYFFLYKNESLIDEANIFYEMLNIIQLWKHFDKILLNFILMNLKKFYCFIYSKCQSSI